MYEKNNIDKLYDDTKLQLQNYKASWFSNNKERAQCIEDQLANHQQNNKTSGGLDLFFYNLFSNEQMVITGDYDKSNDPSITDHLLTYVSLEPAYKPTSCCCLYDPYLSVIIEILKKYNEYNESKEPRSNLSINSCTYLRYSNPIMTSNDNFEKYKISIKNNSKDINRKEKSSSNDEEKSSFKFAPSIIMSDGSQDNSQNNNSKSNLGSQKVDSENNTSKEKSLDRYPHNLKNKDNRKSVDELFESNKNKTNSALFTCYYILTKENQNIVLNKFNTLKIFPNDLLSEDLDEMVIKAISFLELIAFKTNLSNFQSMKIKKSDLPYFWKNRALFDDRKKENPFYYLLDD